MPIRRGKAERHYRKKRGKHHPRDVQEDIWEGIYEEPLVDIETFVASPEHLNADPLFPRQGSALTEFFNPSKAYTELVLKWGKGAGKDYVAACAIAYMVYQALRLPNPQRYYRLAAGDPIDFLNVAYNARQARDVFFKRFKARLNGSPWFKKARAPESLLIVDSLICSIENWSGAFQIVLNGLRGQENQLFHCFSRVVESLDADKKRQAIEPLVDFLMSRDTKSNYTEQVTRA